MSDQDQTPDTIRILSWNIHGTIGRSRKADRDRTLGEIARLSPDVVVLQEVDERTRLGRPADAFDFFYNGLSERLIGTGATANDHALDVREDAGSGCACGNLVWSRFPIRSSEVYALPGPDIETRWVIDVTIETGRSMLQVLGTHLALLPTTRLKQARAIRDRLSDRQSDLSQPTIVLGDLNEWSSRGWVHDTLSGALPHSVQMKTWPERFPIAALDRLYASRDIEIVDARADAEAGKASDHRPIVVDIRIGRG